MLKQPAIEFCRILPEIYEAAEKGEYLTFKDRYVRQPAPRSANIICSRYNYYPLVNSLPAIRANLRPIAELLREGARIDYLASGKGKTLLPFLAILYSNKPLIYLILYLRGLAAFTDIRDNTGKSALEDWTQYGCYGKEIDEFHELNKIVIRHKAIIHEARVLETQGRYFEAFEKYHRAAIMVLDFHQGDRNLIPFYQEEAAGLFYRAAQALVADFSQPVAASSHLLSDQNMQAAKRTNLVCYITGEVMVKLGPGPAIDPRVDKDKLVGPEYFTQFLALISQWQLSKEEPDWNHRELDKYKNRPPSGSGASNGSGDTPCLSGSKDSVAC